MKAQSSLGPPKAGKGWHIREQCRNTFLQQHWWTFEESMILEGFVAIYVTCMAQPAQEVRMSQELWSVFQAWYIKSVLYSVPSSPVLAGKSSLSEDICISYELALTSQGPRWSSFRCRKLEIQWSYFMCIPAHHTAISFYKDTCCSCLFSTQIRSCTHEQQ